MRMKKIMKAINAIEAGFSFLFSILTHRQFIAGMPLAAGIEITNFCNLKCPECPSGSDKLTRTRGFMTEKLFDKFIAEADPYLYNINLYFQGEPMLHPLFFEFIKKCGNIRITVSTNGHFLSEENNHKLAESAINKLIVSLDGMDSRTYSRYRVGGDFEKVLAGIKAISKELLRTRSSVKLEIQFLVNRYNEFQIPAVKQFAKEEKASLKLKSMQVINCEKIEEWMPENEKFRRYRKNENGIFKLNNSFNNSCLRLWMNPVITWDGKVVPCCFDKDANHVMGDLNEESLREIWHGEKFNLFRNAVLKGRQTIEICRNCTTGLKGVHI
jgi:radical SAM protein with 4Fe4S-binding SPASM domain